jgi:hypothetical protein
MQIGDAKEGKTRHPAWQNGYQSVGDAGELQDEGDQGGERRK